MYPKIKLTHKYRVAIFISFVVAFFVLSPLIILYTAGYRYDWEKQKIKKTGVINVNVEPQNAQVFLNGVKINESMPLRLSNRAPGTYHIKITNQGYKDWEKDIKVESNKTTYIKNISLLEKNLPVRILREFNPSSTKKISFSPEGEYAIALNKKSDIYEINLINLNQKDTEVIDRIKSNKLPKIKWRHNYNHVAIISKKDKTNVKTLNLESSEILINKDFDSVVKKEDIKWNGNSFSPHIFLKQKDKIYEISPGDEKMLENIPTSTQAWEVHQNEVFYYDIEEKELNSTKAVKHQMQENIKSFEVIKDNLIIAKTNTGLATFKKLQNKITEVSEISADHVTEFDSPSRWIAWSPWQFWIIGLDGNTNLINRTGQYIKDIKQMSDQNLALIHTKDGLKSFNLHYYVKQKIFTNGKIKKTSVNKERETIYIWGEIGNQAGLFKLEY